MGRSRIPFRSVMVPLGAVVALALTVPAAGQNAPGDFRDFKLPAKPTAAPPVVGPTDGDAPAPRQATPSPTPTRAPAPAPTVALPPPPTATRSPAAPRTAASSAPRPVAAPETATQAAPTDTATPSAAPTTSSGSLFPSAPAPASSALPQEAPASTALPLPADDDDANWWLWPLLAAGLAVLGGLGWAAWRRRREAVRTPPEFVRPRVPEPVAAPSAEAPSPAAIAPVAPAPAFANGPARSSLAIALEATRMSATLLNATLSYRLVVTNTGNLPVSEVSVAGDMISAHASVSNADMLGADGAAMPSLHRITALAPGESMTLTGDIRLPLSAITPIRRGEAQLFVPLARFRTSGMAAGVPVTELSAFLVGQEPEARAKLQPFRLDLGPRLYSQIGQRPIVVAA